MGIFPGEAVVRTAIKLGLEDLRANPWLVEDAMSDFLSNPHLAKAYGRAEVDRCKEWFASNRVEVVLAHRQDRNQYPCVVVSPNGGPEDDEKTTMADLSTEVEVLDPAAIGKTIKYVVDPFVPASYDEESGLLEAPESVDLSRVAAGMVLVDPATGVGWTVGDHGGENGLLIDDAPDLPAGSRFGVAPRHRLFRARREHRFFKESYSIGCEVAGDVSELLWLSALVLYSLLRYKESLLEAGGMYEARLSVGPIAPGALSESGAGNLWTREIQLSGSVEQSWLKTPRRVIESVALADGDGGGIKVISQAEPAAHEGDDALWITTDE